MQLSLLGYFATSVSTFTACRKVRKSERNIKFTLIFLSERSTFMACRKVRKSERNNKFQRVRAKGKTRFLFAERGGNSIALSLLVYFSANAVPSRPAVKYEKVSEI